jgi:hypothetical protein
MTLDILAEQLGKGYGEKDWLPLTLTFPYFRICNSCEGRAPDGEYYLLLLLAVFAL